MTTDNYQDLLCEEIRKLEAEFKFRRDNGRRMSRSVAAAYRKSIERRTEQLRSLSLQNRAIEGRGPDAAR